MVDKSSGRPIVVSIVVNFRGLAETRACLASLLAVDYPAHEIVVVDNASEGGDAAALQAEFDGRVRVIASERNVGYGGAANLGLRAAIDRGAAYAWVLNNDTLFARGSVAALVEAMESDPAYGAASPVIDAPVGPEAPGGIWYAGGTANAARASARHVLEPIDPTPGIVPTGFVTGCAMFIRVAALDRVGLFWPELFLYWEDVDLSYRFVAAGWRLGVVPLARITHLVHGSVHSELATYYFYRNALLVAQRHGHTRGAARAILALTTRAARRWAACTIKGLRPFPTAETRGLLAGMKALFTGPPEPSSGDRDGPAFV